MSPWKVAAISGLAVVFVCFSVTVLRARDGGGAALPEQGARLVSPSEVAQLDDLVGHPVFWAGARPGNRLEYRADGTGSVRLRYLSDQAPVGSSTADYLDISTYPFAGAYPMTRRLASNPGMQPVRVGEGIGFYDPDRPFTVVMSWAGLPDIQVEVFDPVRFRALELVQSGQLVPAP